MLEATIHARRESERVLIGYDFPIGIPAPYAAAAHVDCFRTLLAGVGRASPWERFWDAVDPAAAPSVHQPLYPARNGAKGTVKKASLARGIGVGSFDDLKRRIDRDQDAECMFWAVGAKQVAKAAFSGWREELQPSMHRTRLWPFDGKLPTLLAEPGVVVAEVYPAAAARRIGAKPTKKSDPDARRTVAGSVLMSLARSNCTPTDEARTQIESGFEGIGDDAFDACVAAAALLDVVLNYSQRDEPPTDVETRTEGWILGVR